MSPEQALQTLLEGSASLGERPLTAASRSCGSREQIQRAKALPARLASATPVPAEDESDRLQEVVVTAGQRAAPSACRTFREHYRHRSGQGVEVSHDNFIDYAAMKCGLGFQDLESRRPG